MGLRQSIRYAPDLKTLDHLKREFSTYLEASDKTKRGVNNAYAKRKKELEKTEQ